MAPIFIRWYNTLYLGMTTIKIDPKVKKKLEDLKVHPREPYNDVIRRLLEHYEKSLGKMGRKP